MKAARLQQIEKGKLWKVYPDGKPDEIMFEGSATACRRFIRERHMAALHKRGAIRLGKLIWETQ